jgi:hypothetical protein
MTTQNVDTNFYGQGSATEGTNVSGMVDVSLHWELDGREVL